MTSSRAAYPSDVSDEEWALVAPYLALLREDAAQREHSLRKVFNGLRCVVKTGAPWRWMPNDLPPWEAVYQQAQRWLAAGCFEQLADDLRALLRLASGRDPEPTAAIFDRTPRNTPSMRGGVVIPLCCRRWEARMGQPGFFDLDERYQHLSENGDPLVKLAALIDFEAFRPKLATELKRSDGSKGGRPPYDEVLMFKILVLQTLYTLSDDATEFQIRDRLSFMRFLGLGFEDAVPDAKTVWLFREHLTRAGAIDDLFAAFDAWLKGKGYLAMSGQIIDASIIAAPRQRNTDAEKADLKEGRIPEAWAAKPKKLAQKDRDARWTLKRAKARPAEAAGSKAKVEIAIPVFGYKTHVSIDRKHGFVRRFTVTSAAAHNGAQLANILDPANTASDVWADTAYRSKTNEAYLAKQGRRSKIHFRRHPGLDLTPLQRKANRARSRIRSALETVFAGQKHRFGLFVRTIGLARARTKIGLANLAYNLKRFLWIEARPVAA